MLSPPVDEAADYGREACVVVVGEHGVGYDLNYLGFGLDVALADEHEALEGRDV